jgi:predicted enzyme related to lactoylglutathione lyase
MTASILILLVAMAMAAQTAPAPKLHVSMIALGVTDMARSVQFYRETLGLQLIGQPAEVTMLRAGEVTLALNQPLGRASTTALVGALEIIFPVESVAISYKDLAARGCRFVREPREVTASIWAATFTDPDGHRLTILGPR